MQEKALKLERERKNKAIADRLSLEAEFIKKKYELLQLQLDEDSESSSVRSRRSAVLNTGKVQDWVNSRTDVTLGTNTGISQSTGPTSQAVEPAALVPTSESSNNLCGDHLVSPLVASIPAQSTPHSNKVNEEVTQHQSVVTALTAIKDTVAVQPTTQSTVGRGASQQLIAETATTSPATALSTAANNQFSGGLKLHNDIVHENYTSIGPVGYQNVAADYRANYVFNNTGLRYNTQPIWPAQSCYTGTGSVPPMGWNCNSVTVSNTPLTAVAVSALPPSSLPSINAWSNNTSLNRPFVKSVPSYQTPIFSVPQATNPATRSPTGPTAQQIAARQVVSKDLPSFSGDPAEWALFWNSYIGSTEMCGFTDAENLVRLQRCIKGEARKAVSCFLLHPSHVPEVINTLQTLFGRPDAIINSLLNEVRATPAPKPEKLATLINFGLVVRNLCAHLVNTGQEAHLANPTLLQELVDKLPANIKLDWALTKQRYPVVDLRIFAEYMSVIVSAASSVTSVVEPCAQRTERHNGKSFVNPHTLENVTDREYTNVDESKRQTARSERPCMVCQDVGHKPKDCTVFHQSCLADRWKIVTDLHLCRRCLFPHGRWPCKAPLCGVNGCQQRHHRLLHSTEQAENVYARAGTVAVHHNAPLQTLFRMIPVTLHGNGKSVATLAFLDSGSDSTLVEKSIADKLGLAGPADPLCMQWTNGVKRTEVNSRRVQLFISGNESGQRYALNGVRTINSLGLPRQSIKFEDFERVFPHLQGLPIKSYSEASPGIWIGLDNTRMKTTLELREGRKNEPVATKTRLGWVLFGNANKLDNPVPSHIFHICAHTYDQQLHELVKQFFAVEGAGVSHDNAIESANDKRARAILKATTTRTSSGRFQTGLLWKFDQVVLPNSKIMAERRLYCLEKRLAKFPELYANVRKQISDYQSKGYAHVASDGELANFGQNPVWYLPLGVVINPRKPEKVRVVWDAAAMVRGVSLNSVLLKGPDLLTSLPAVLSRYRQRQIAISGDIREMFHQVLIRPEDRQAQRFLWRDNPSLPIKVFVMDVATFGSSCSPCSLQYIKNLNANEHAQTHPVAAAAVVANHYVDDYLDSTDTVDEAIHLVSDVKTVHANGGFEIRHWLSSSPEVLERVGGENSDKMKSFVLDKTNAIERVLGMVWLPQEDVFSFSIELRDGLAQLLLGERIPTKREVLSLVMSVFDPLGLVAVFLIHGKVMLQDIWRAVTDWDDRISAQLLPRWKQWILLLQDLRNIKVQRCYFPGYRPSTYDTLELHVFVDASETSYAAAAYFRVIDGDEVRCTLVQAKTKVAPLKPLSIPRLELQAAVIGTRLMKSIVSSHTLQIKRKVMWSDSNTVLAWLAADPRKRTQFVAFRIGEILENTELGEWKWVQSKWNVADEATKWGKGPCLNIDSRWFRGPEFLYKDEECWPRNKMNVPDTTEELRPIYVHPHVVVKPVVEFSRFSKWERLLRAVAYARRFILRCRYPSDSPNTVSLLINREELVGAENAIWRLVQAESFSDEWVTLQTNLNLSVNQQTQIWKGSKLYKLSPLFGTDGVIRMKRRLGEAPWISIDVKFPVILPKEHYVTDLLIDWFHRKFVHANSETVVNEIRQTYHIPALRVRVRNVGRRCAWCKVYRAAPEIPRMGSLPAPRITPYVRPFTFVGLDYFGPIIVRLGRNDVKRWVALFTCLTVRALHLEIVSSLSTESCKMAIRRFIGRRGAPQEIYSDQGTNFQGCSRELSIELNAMNEQLAQTSTNTTTQWKFNPPYAPHMGGAWERLVRSVKAALSTLLMHKKPNDETLSTVLIEAESIVNSRPLTYVPLDDAEQEAITPNHFLLLSTKGVNQPTTLPTDVRFALRSNWKLTQVMLDNFWRRWIRKYLPIIARQTKWFNARKSLQVGDLVILVDEGVRNSWTRGKILEVYPGKDGHVRRAKVQTKSGIFERPATKLALVDIREMNGTAEETSSHTGGGMLA
ncbi:uncharacterized protein LOC129720559 [Wyeomyia smithii]|uniref:uncharacterized protein LOC129720559 n=1 Tax=Wyeomyia smithii TaxID=174621 RepID=UPI0024680440|nr:uncharacterized protein LOC129720559 [Wyeomyia smithii]